MRCASSRDALGVTAPLWLPPCIAPGPTNRSVTHVDDMFHAWAKSLGPHQRKCVDIRMGHLRLEPCCGGEQCSPLGNNVVDQQQPLRRRGQWGDGEGLIVLPHARPPAGRRSSRFLDSDLASQPRPDRQPKTHIAERNGELQRWPERLAVPGSAPRYRNQQRPASKQRRESGIAECRPEHNSCIARKPPWIGRFHSLAYLTRGLSNRSHTSR